MKRISNCIVDEIIEGKYLDAKFELIRKELFKNGPINEEILEMIAYLKIFQMQEFKNYEADIIDLMGLFFKKTKPTSLFGFIMDAYHQGIKEKYNHDYTPLQVSILESINENQIFSFSAPTSTGKSYVFRELIRNAKKDVVIIVPSRALINEYYEKTCEIISENRKTINVLTFVDHINIQHAIRNIFILTPERARELFKNKDWLAIELFLFDEAQLSDEESERGIYFDSIVRRAKKAFPKAKYIFAHPFISNPEAQIKKNKFENECFRAEQYEQRNVGQVFYLYEKETNGFYMFDPIGNLIKSKIDLPFDPIEKVLKNNGSILVYTSKSSIIDKSIYKKFEKYIKICKKIEDRQALSMIEELRIYIGASDNEKDYFESDMLEKLSHGIVSHHGSMPLNARLVLEHFTQQGFCRICFATSTLEQGINMPFDVVFIDRLESSKPLSVKNLIGRAGRSTEQPIFDYGTVIINKSAKGRFEKVIKEKIKLKDKSMLEQKEDEKDEKYKEFKEAILDGSFSDEYNLTEKDLKRIQSNNSIPIIKTLLDCFFTDNDFNDNHTKQKETIKCFKKLYEIYLGRALTDGEERVLINALYIMLAKIKERTFSNICRVRYSYISCVKERRNLDKEQKKDEIRKIKVKNLLRYTEIPNTKNFYSPLFSKETLAVDADYDLIVFDTYDYLDKLIGNKLVDVFYAFFEKYYKTVNDERAKKMSMLVKYGTFNEKQIWILRYGFSFEDISWISSCIDKINENEIVFNSNILSLTKDKMDKIAPFNNWKRE